MNNNKRILVVHVGGIGDFLLACPAISVLKPYGEITLLGRKERLMLAVAGGLANAAYDMDDINFDSVFSTPSERLCAFFSQFDAALIWMNNASSIEHAMRTAGISYVSSFPGLPPSDWQQHASDYYIECATALIALLKQEISEKANVYADVLSPCHSERSEESRSIRSTPSLHISPDNHSHDIIIHPGSGSKLKNWPIERFCETADALIKEGHEVTWLMGPAETAIELPHDAQILQLDSLLEIAAILASARCYLGNDSGITHLAAAVGCPTVAIFGPTNPQIWGPPGKHVSVVCKSVWPDVNNVLEIVFNRVDWRRGRL